MKTKYYSITVLLCEKSLPFWYRSFEMLIVKKKVRFQLRVVNITLVKFLKSHKSYNSPACVNYSIVK